MLLLLLGFQITLTESLSLRGSATEINPASSLMQSLGGSTSGVKCPYSGMDAYSSTSTECMSARFEAASKLLESLQSGYNSMQTAYGEGQSFMSTLQSYNSTIERAKRTVIGKGKSLGMIADPSNPNLYVNASLNYAAVRQFANIISSLSTSVNQQIGSAQSAWSNDYAGLSDQTNKFVNTANGVLNELLEEWQSQISNAQADLLTRANAVISQMTSSTTNRSEIDETFAGELAATLDRMSTTFSNEYKAMTTNLTTTASYIPSTVGLFGNTFTNVLISPMQTMETETYEPMFLSNASTLIDQLATLNNTLATNASVYAQKALTNWDSEFQLSWGDQGDGLLGDLNELVSETNLTLTNASIALEAQITDLQEIYEFALSTVVAQVAEDSASLENVDTEILTSVHEAEQWGNSALANVSNIEGLISSTKHDLLTQLGSGLSNTSSSVTAQLLEQINEIQRTRIALRKARQAREAEIASIVANISASMGLTQDEFFDKITDLSNQVSALQELTGLNPSSENAALAANLEMKMLQAAQAATSSAAALSSSTGQAAAAMAGNAGSLKSAANKAASGAWADVSDASHKSADSGRLASNALATEAGQANRAQQALEGRLQNLQSQLSDIQSKTNSVEVTASGSISLAADLLSGASEATQQMLQSFIAFSNESVSKAASSTAQQATQTLRMSANKFLNSLQNTAQYRVNTLGPAVYELERQNISINAAFGSAMTTGSQVESNAQSTSKAIASIVDTFSHQLALNNATVSGGVQTALSALQSEANDLAESLSRQNYDSISILRNPAQSLISLAQKNSENWADTLTDFAPKITAVDTSLEKIVDSLFNASTHISIEELSNTLSALQNFGSIAKTDFKVITTSQQNAIDKLTEAVKSISAEGKVNISDIVSSIPEKLSPFLTVYAEGLLDLINTIEQVHLNTQANNTLLWTEWEALYNLGLFVTDFYTAGKNDINDLSEIQTRATNVFGGVLASYLLNLEKAALTSGKAKSDSLALYNNITGAVADTFNSAYSASQEQIRIAEESYAAGIAAGQKAIEQSNEQMNAQVKDAESLVGSTTAAVYSANAAINAEVGNMTSSQMDASAYAAMVAQNTSASISSLDILVNSAETPENILPTPELISAGLEAQQALSLWNSTSEHSISGLQAVLNSNQSVIREIKVGILQGVNAIQRAIASDLIKVTDSLNDVSVKSNGLTQKSAGLKEAQQAISDFDSDLQVFYESTPSELNSTALRIVSDAQAQADSEVETVKETLNQLILDADSALAPYY